MIKKCLLCAKKKGLEEVQISLVLDPTIMDMQQSLFFLTTKNNSKGAMVEACSLNPLQTLMKVIDHIPNCCAKDFKVHQVG
jgi:hypothetical protein